MNYWGPLANHKSSDWIVDATCAVMRHRRNSRPICSSPTSRTSTTICSAAARTAREADKALDLLLGYLTRLEGGLRGVRLRLDHSSATTPSSRVKRGRDLSRTAPCAKRGSFTSREVRGMAYTDFFTSRAFAVVDHQIAHVYCRDAAAMEAARAVLEPLPGRRRGARSRGAGGARPRARAHAAISCSSRRAARGLPIHGLRKRRRRTTPATSISTTSPATIRASCSSAGRRAA